MASVNALEDAETFARSRHSSRTVASGQSRRDEPARDGRPRYPNPPRNLDPHPRNDELLILLLGESQRYTMNPAASK